MPSKIVEEVDHFNKIIQNNSDKVELEAGEDFIITPYVENIIERAKTYLEIGCPIHLAGPAGTGKTTLAFHIAASLKRPVVLIHGDDEFNSSDLIGKDSGYRKSKLVDNYIHSVLKTQEEMETYWVDNRLTTACKKGYTLVYDEFTRSKPEANNVLLSILEEKILDLPSLRRYGESYFNVHPNFRAIFTSNPEEYAGTHKTQDALMDRLVTIQLDHYDRESEIAITVAKSKISQKDAIIIVDIVRELRELGGDKHHPTIRACIAIGLVLKYKGAHANYNNPVFKWACHDILRPGLAKVIHSGKSIFNKKIEGIIRKISSNEQNYD